MARKEASLVGREEELSRLRELVAPPYPESRVMLLLGDPGLGKTVLLTEGAREARAAGMRVLAAAGPDRVTVRGRSVRAARFADVPGRGSGAVEP